MDKNQKDKFKNNNNRRSTTSRKRRNFMNLGLLISLVSIMIMGSSISYILVKNDLSVKGFVINDLQKEVNYLNKQKDSLELDLTLIESYNSLAIRVEELGMVKSDKIDYINPGDDYVALR
ncbi:MAG: hypothetical protein PF572_03780 [Patescibacteria group bacterium]|jgi:NhaP-type Na+/H+ and K+/H+ antiporter|nr:hypothetical protein [Patescibacteria group bacterium]